MADMTPLADILNGDDADATPVQSNFQIIEAYINGTNLVRTDGTEVMTDDLDMDSNKVVNLTNGSASTDAVNLGQVSNAISLAANTQAAAVETLQSTTSLSYADLSTVGPSVTCTTGASALVLMDAYSDISSGGQYIYLSFAVSGATTLAASDDRAILRYGAGGAFGLGGHVTGMVVLTGLTPGSNTFTLKYRGNVAGTVNYARRRIAVVPLF